MTDDRFIKFIPNVCTICRQKEKMMYYLKIDLSFPLYVF